MKTINAKPGEHVYNFLNRVWHSEPEDVIITHNDVTIIMYSHSVFQDVVDKFNMQIKINQLEYKLEQLGEKQ